MSQGLLKDTYAWTTSLFFFRQYFPNFLEIVGMMGIQLSCPNLHYLIFWVGTSIYLDACSSIINELILVEEKEEDENINKQTTTVTNCLVLVAPSLDFSTSLPLQIVLRRYIKNMIVWHIERWVLQWVMTQLKLFCCSFWQRSKDQRSLKSLASTIHDFSFIFLSKIFVNSTRENTKHKREVCGFSRSGPQSKLMEAN